MKRGYNAWNVALWLGNDEGLYQLMLEAILETNTREEAAAMLLDMLPRETPDGVRYTKTNVIHAMRGRR